MNYVLLTVSVISTMLSGMINSIYGKKTAKNEADFQVFNLFSSVVCAVIILITAFAEASAMPSAYTVVLGLLFGVVTALGTLFTVKALGMGSVSYTTLITTSSMIIPALSGWVFFDETIMLSKIFGIVLMLISISLAVINKDEKKRKVTLKWLVFALSAGLFSGLVGVLQKIHQSSPHSNELMFFLVIAFAVSASYSAIMLLISKAKNITPSIKLSLKNSCIYMFAASGLVVSIPNMINLYLSGVMDSIIFFPIVNGANLFLMFLVSLILFREKLCKTQWLGFIIGCAAIGILCL